MKFIKEADARAKEKELKDKKTEAIKKAREIESKRNGYLLENITRLVCQSHVTKWP